MTIFKNPKKNTVSVTNTGWLMLFREGTTVYCENHTKSVSASCRQDRGYLKVNGTYSNRCASRH
jgi:hypothetical protein